MRRSVDVATQQSLQLDHTGSFWMRWKIEHFRRPPVLVGLNSQAVLDRFRPPPQASLGIRELPVAPPRVDYLPRSETGPISSCGRTNISRFSP